MSFKSLTSLFLLSGLLLSCATPPEKPKPESAFDVAQNHLEQEMPSVNTVSSEPPISALPKNKIEPPREINQIGSLPTIKTSTETAPKFDLKAGQPLKFNFEQVPLRDVVQILADTMGISIVVDTAIGAEKITMRTADGKDLNKKDLWPLLQLLLSESGITMEKRGGVYYLKKIGAGSGLPGTIGLKLSGKGDSSQVLQITPLRYITAESASAAVTPMIQPQGRILNLANLNIIGIVTTPTILDRVNRLLQIIDADPFIHRGIRLFRLQNSKATEIKSELDQILQAVMGSAPAYQVIALERINAILIIAPPEGGFKEVEMWLNVLDEQRDESTEQIFIYRVKNLEAKELAATLSSVFEQNDKEDDEVEKKSDPDPTLPVGQLPLQVSDNETASEKRANNRQSNNTSIAISAELKVNIVADEKTNSLLIRATPRDYQQLLETIRILDRVPKEVMVNVVIAQVTLTETTKFGIDWTALINKFGVNANGETSQSNIGTNFGTTSTGGLVLNYFSGDITALLNLVDSDSSVSLLSRPSILVRNNEEASINVGTNEPVITRTNSTTSNVNTVGYTSNEVQYRDTGIILKVTPRINDDGIINMKVSQEVSQIDTSRGEQQYPAFSQRKIETDVVVRDATAIVIGGLIQDNGNYGNSGLPFLRKTKLKPLFSSTSNENTRTELVLIIVPQIVNPEINNDPLLKQFNSQMHLVSSLFIENDMNFNFFTQEYRQGQGKYNNSSQ